MKCKCGSDKFGLLTKTFENGSVIRQAYCKDCEFTDDELTLKMNDEGTIFNPALFVMPFGRNKGKYLFQIVRHDYQYLLWASNKIDDEEIREKINNFLHPVGVLWEMYNEDKIWKKEHRGDSRQDIQEEGRTQ